MASARTGVTLVAIVGMLAAMAGCGSGDSDDAFAGPPAPPAVPATRLTPIPVPAGNDCPAVVLTTLGRVLQRIYNEGVSSEEVLAARSLIRRDATLHEAVEGGDAKSAEAATAGLIATKHMTDLTIERHGRVLANAGAPAMAPLQGELTGAGGRPIGSYLTTLFSDHTFVSEAKGITQGQLSVRAGDAVRAGNATLGDRQLHGVGTLTRGGIKYEYLAFPVAAYPAGTATVELFRTTRSLAPLCRPTREATVVQTLRGVATLIYKGESGPQARLQVRRVQSYQPLLEAVAERNPAATRRAIDILLHKHVVRLRVRAGGALLADVGGPYVLAPLRAPLKRDGRRIGELVLSIQDDEGYKRLAERLAGVRVVMSAGGKVVKNSLGPISAPVPASGPYTYRGRAYTVFTVPAEAFPSGPLTIRVLVPDPYL